jgi:hypothetical protein
MKMALMPMAVACSKRLDVIVHIDTRRGRSQFSCGIEYAGVQCIRCGGGEHWCCPSFERATPPNLVKVRLILLDEGCVKEEVFLQSGLNSMDDFPIGRAEVCAEC